MLFSYKRGKLTDSEINAVAKKIFELPNEEAFSEFLFCSMEFKRRNLTCSINDVPIKKIRDEIIKLDFMKLEEEEYNRKIFAYIKSSRAEERTQFLKICFVSAKFPNLRPSREYRDLIHKYTLNGIDRRNRSSCLEVSHMQSCKKIKDRFFNESCNLQIRFETLYTLLNRCSRTNCRKSNEADTIVCCIRHQRSALKDLNDLNCARINHIIGYIGLNYLEKTALFLEMIDSENQLSAKENMLLAILESLTLNEAS